MWLYISVKGINYKQTRYDRNDGRLHSGHSMMKATCHRCFIVDAAVCDNIFVSQIDQSTTDQEEADPEDDMDCNIL